MTTAPSGSPVIAGSSACQPWSERRIVVASIAWTWTVYLVLIATRLVIIQFPRLGLLFGRHCIVALAGAAVVWCVYLLLRKCRRIGIVGRVVVTAVVLLPAASTLTLVSYAALYVLAPEAVWSARVLGTVTLSGVIARVLPEMYLLLASWATLYDAVISTIESRDAQQQAATLRAETREAQLRALRYQLNPHFLFNALNSLSALVMLRDQDRAERVIQGLSQFLRSALEYGESGEVTLAEELEVQRLYLEIEQVRFGERLRVEWMVSDEVNRAEVPALLLQPIIENVLCHAVAPVSSPVTMTIAAHADRDSLHLVVEDDGRGQGVAGGTGIGLANVASRLGIHYGDAARCDRGPRPAGGFRVEVVLPLRLRPCGG